MIYISRVRDTKLFRSEMATSLGEGKLYSNQQYSALELALNYIISYGENINILNYGDQQSKTKIILYESY